MKQKPKIIIAIKKIFAALITIALLASAGCGGGAAPAPKQVLLNVWDPFEHTENLQPLISDYQQKHPNVRIVFTKKDVTTYSSDLLDALGFGQRPGYFLPLITRGCRSI